MIFLRSQSIQEGIPHMRTVKSLVEELSRIPGRGGACSVIGGANLLAAESPGGPCQLLRYRSTVAQVQVATPVPKKS